MESSILNEAYLNERLKTLAAEGEETKDSAHEMVVMLIRLNLAIDAMAKDIAKLAK